MRTLLLIAALAALPLLAADDANIWSDSDLAVIHSKLTKNLNADHYALETFGQFGNHNVLMVYREASGPSETHAEWTDFYVVQSGTATLLVGGSVANPRVDSPGEVRGTGVDGARRVELKKGDVVNIPPGTAHQVVVAEGKPITYLIVKVKKAD
jgi:mannose-6-phosphate isomerase-like protein (cupin superfamily)